jgi:hypothetical protein
LKSAGAVIMPSHEPEPPDLGWFWGANRRHHRLAGVRNHKCLASRRQVHQPGELRSRYL